MKNIHVITTEKPSRLFESNDKLMLAGFQTTFKTGKNIQITNDDKIQDGEHGLNKFNEVVKYQNGYGYNNYKKIILTTDPELIKDGVQAIDDEFLEWFVKNQSCEFVEVENYVQSTKNGHIVIYDIIIPQKETPKTITDKQYQEALAVIEAYRKKNGMTVMQWCEGRNMSRRLFEALMGSGFEFIADINESNFHEIRGFTKKRIEEFKELRK